MTKHFQGGYDMIDDPLVRSHGRHAHTSLDMDDLSEYTIDAVNYIQETPWQTNDFMLGVAKSLAKTGFDYHDPTKDKDHDSVVFRGWRPDHPDTYFEKMPQEEWNVLSNEAKAEKRKVRAKAIYEYKQAASEFSSTKRIVGLADQMSQFDQFYFPHNLDFRLRIYPIPNELNPQTNDLAKALIKFAKGTPLGSEGLYWLGVNVTSHWGEDKLSLDDRYKFADRWVTDNKQSEEAWGWLNDPAKNTGWMAADKPYQFLAVLHEWVYAHTLDNPDSFMSFIAGTVDGTCNGAQHLSIMARDQVGAEATNCTSVKERKDLYMEVADRVLDRCLKDAKGGSPMATYWVNKLNKPSERRKVVKRAVMTVPYGVTEYGIAEFMIKDRHVEKSEWDSAKYIRDHIVSSIGETLSNGIKLQVWFTQCAVLCAEAGLPMSWDTPAGSKVTQAYRNLIQGVVRTNSGRFYVYEEPSPDENDDEFLRRIGMKVSKSGTSAPPNVTHSCDAAHLQITTCRMYEAGIRSFSMVHDSFGCPMAQVGLMSKILRQSVVDMYEDNYLQRFKESVEKYSGLKMPDHPELGEFDVTDILNSEYFFS